MTHIPEQPWIPDAEERAKLNADLLKNGTDTGWYDEHGTPAPWPDDIEGWRPSAYDPIPLNPGEQPF